MINFYITLSCGLRAWGKSFQKENSRFDLESDTSSFRFFSKYLSRMLFIEVFIFYFRHFCFQLQRYHHLTNWFLFIYILHILIEWKDRMRAKYFLVRFDYFASNHTTTTLALPSLPISAFFLVEPPTQSRAAFPSPPPLHLCDLAAASKRGFFSNVYQHDTLKLTGCFTLIIHLLDVPKLWREVTR